MSLIEVYVRLVSAAKGDVILWTFLSRNIVYIQQEYSLFQKLYPNQSARLAFVQWVGAIQCREACKVISKHLTKNQATWLSEGFATSLKAFYQVIGIMSTYGVLYDVVNYDQSGLWEMISDPSLCRVSDSLMQKYFDDKLKPLPDENKRIVVKLALKFILNLVKDSELLAQYIFNFYVKTKDILKFIFCFIPEEGVFLFPSVNYEWLNALMYKKYLSSAAIIKIKSIFMNFHDGTLDNYLPKLARSNMRMDNRLSTISELRSLR